MTKIVVIGAGQAGASMVAKLRSEGFDGSLTLIGAEPDLPYQRPPLSKAYLLGDMERERLFLKPQSFYDEQGISLRLWQTISHIDHSSKQVYIEDEALSYDHLAFATGARPRTLPAEMGGTLKGVYSVRDLADIDAMAPHIAKGKRVLIVGGGYIGLEAAAVCAKKEMHVTLIEAAPRILQRVASEETASYFKNLHKSYGVDIRENCGLTRLTGQTHVTGAELQNGESLDIDIAIVGIGVETNSELAQSIGCEIDNGIATDAYGQTNLPNVWAAGDCASFPYKDSRIRLESVPNAIEQAETVARNMLGAQAPYLAKPWFWSDQYDVKLQIAGLNTGFDRVVTRSIENAQSHWYYKESQLIAVDAMNAPRDYMVGKRMIEAGKSPDPSKVRDPSIDAKGLMQ